MSETPSNNKKRIQELSEKWLDGTITETERQEYDLWYSSFEDREIHDLTEHELNTFLDEKYKSIKERENIDIFPLKKGKKLSRALLIAASISLFVLSFTYLYYSYFEREKENQESLYSSIVPGRDQAILSLDNGMVFNLDSLGNGEIFEKNGVRIEKSKDGELIYSVLDSQSDKEVLMNTVSTPRGGQFKISLSDGTQVWMNAASTLKFPTVFAAENRTVELIGEAYFEVAENKHSPFKVITENEEVEVLGTHFNVNSYKEEETSSVALLEGKVKVSLPSAESKILMPGQQSILKAGIMQVYPVDLQEAIAWKNGEFMFNNENIESVFRKVARWYDVEIFLTPGLEEIFIWGSVSRYKNFAEVLKVIELTDESIKFKIEGRRVYVMK